MMQRSEQAAGKENSAIPVRVRFFDDLLVRFSYEVDQVVLLGAGFDSRAFRLPVNPCVRMFELDSAETMAEKVALLEGAVSKCEVTYVGTKFETDWVKDLSRQEFDISATTLWIAEGLLFYLSSDQVSDLLNATRLASGTRSVFAADICAPGILSLEQMKLYLDWLCSHDRPAPFCCDEPERLFQLAGWSFVDSVQLGQTGANFGRLPTVPDGIPIQPTGTFISIAKV